MRAPRRIFPIPQNSTLVFERETHRIRLIIFKCVPLFCVLFFNFLMGLDSPDTYPLCTTHWSHLRCVKLLEMRSLFCVILLPVSPQSYLCNLGFVPTDLWFLLFNCSYLLRVSKNTSLEPGFQMCSVTIQSSCHIWSNMN